MANKEKTALVFIIDRSGSMGGLEDATIKGFNEFMLEQRNAAGEALATVVLFDDRYEILFDKINVKDIPDLDRTTNLARGTTALRDAVGRSIFSIKDWIYGLNEEDRPAKVLFIITTDGQDNASTDFSVERLAEAIKLQREVDGWEFIFTGASEDLITTAQTYGISKGNVLQFANTAVGISNSYSAMNNATLMYRSASVGDKNTSANLFVNSSDTLDKDKD